MTTVTLTSDDGSTSVDVQVAPSVSGRFRQAACVPAADAHALRRFFTDLDPSAAALYQLQSTNGEVIEVDLTVNDSEADAQVWEGLPCLADREDLVVIRKVAPPPGPGTPAPAPNHARTSVLIIEDPAADSSTLSSEAHTLNTLLRPRFMVEHLVQSGGPSSAAAEWVHVSMDKIAKAGDLDASLFGGAKLIVLNASNTTCLARELAERGGCVVVGWQYQVSNALAFAFARVFYQHLITGKSVAEALRAFVAQQRRLGSKLPLLTPAVWTADPKLTRTPLVAGRSDTTRSLGNYVTFSGVGGAQPGVAIECTIKPYLCPALLRGGLTSPLSGLHITRHGRTINDARIIIRCDTGEAHSEWSFSTMLESGTTAFTNVSEINFPAVHALIDRRVDRRIINVHVQILDGDRSLAETTLKTVFLGANEWLDDAETRGWLPAYVLAHATKVRELMTLPSASSDGLACCKTRMQQVFDKLKHTRLGYALPPGVGVFVPRDKIAEAGASIQRGGRLVGQRVRFPREILEYKRGTCHDLALLLAACAEYLGVPGVLLLRPGHTTFGFWSSPEAHRAFWKQRRIDLTGRTTVVTDNWVLRSGKELRTLIANGDLHMLEATDLTREAIDFEGSVKLGKRDASRLSFDALIDVSAARAWVEPIRYEYS